MKVSLSEDGEKIIMEDEDYQAEWNIEFIMDLLNWDKEKVLKELVEGQDKVGLEQLITFSKKLRAIPSEKMTTP